MQVHCPVHSTESHFHGHLTQRCLSTLGSINVYYQSGYEGLEHHHVKRTGQRCHCCENLINRTKSNTTIFKENQCNFGFVLHLAWFFVQRISIVTIAALFQGHSYRPVFHDLVIILTLFLSISAH